MGIVVVGIDHTTAPIELRELLARSEHHIMQLLQAVKRIAQECVVLSTCNRLEVYATETQPELLLNVLSDVSNVAELAACSYTLTDHDAVAHLCGVASGLYSLVPGEPQIQGQVSSALEVAQSGRYAGSILSALFRTALISGKRARSETGISRNAVSISHVAVQLARRLFPAFEAAHVLLIGSGKMSELAARNLRNNGAGHLTIVNRTHERAIDLAQLLQARHRPFEELSEALYESDVVISSTTAPHTLITYEAMASIMRRRAARPLLLIDIALPRDVEPAVAHLPGVHLYNLDDLRAEVEHGIDLRLQEAELVHAIIAEETDTFERWLASLSVVECISDLRQHAEIIRQQELARALRRLAPDLSEKEQAVMQEFSTRLMNKLLHTPMLRLKEAAVSGQGQGYAEAIRYLFALEDDGYEAKDNDRDASQQTRNDTDTAGYPAAAHALAQSRNRD
jgi:glutamyl-tRNA reductase